MKNREAYIIKGIRSGQESAYKTLFNDYYRPLSIYALKYVGDLESSKEIVQEFFVHLFENRHKLIANTSLQSYLYRAIRNRCLNHIKQNQIHKKHLDQYQSGQLTNEDLEARILETELEHRIFKIIESLPPQCRKIFTLSRSKGFTNAEIAFKLDISKRTVETQISKALKVLRKDLEEP